jgi:hypothetical protein
MKMPTLTITAAFLLFTLSGFAQQEETEPVPVVKGYYAIGNNAKKLAPAKEVGPAVRPTPPKGYYALTRKQRKAQAPPPGNYLGAKQPRHIVRPVVTKGYYAIGNNAEKL